VIAPVVTGPQPWAFVRWKVPVIPVVCPSVPVKVMGPLLDHVHEGGRTVRFTVTDPWYEFPVKNSIGLEYVFAARPLICTLTVIVAL